MKCKHCNSNLIPLKKGLLYHPDVVCSSGYGKVMNLNIDITDDELYSKFKDEHKSDIDFDWYIDRIDNLEKEIEKLSQKKSIKDRIKGFWGGLFGKK